MPHTIAENLQRLTAAKTAIGNAITAKGGTVAQGDGFEEFATDISNIPYNSDTRNDTVTADTLKSGYTAHNAAGQIITGTLLSQSTTVTAETLGQGVTAYNSAGQLITGTAYVNKWYNLREKVRNNDMSDIAIRSQYTCLQGTSELVWDVIGKNIDTPSSSRYSNSLTLKTHFPFGSSCLFDTPEAFFACIDTPLVAGTYYFKEAYDGKNYSFTLTQDVPKGGQLTINRVAASRTVSSYASPTSQQIESVTATRDSSAGTYLGATSWISTNGGLNVCARYLAGSNNWKESNARQWLNSDKPGGQWWTPQTPWDRCSYTTNPGFMYNLEDDFLSVINKTRVTTVDALGSNQSYETDDYFFLLSRTQMYGGNEYPDTPEGVCYPFYSDYSDLSEPGEGNDTNRIVYNSAGTAVVYRIRTASEVSATGVRHISTGGYVNDGGSQGSPNAWVDYIVACNII